MADIEKKSILYYASAPFYADLYHTVMKKHKTLLIAMLLLCHYAKALHITIIESSITNSGHKQDLEWKAAATNMGHTSSIVPQSTLDNTNFFSGTDILIISSLTTTMGTGRVNNVRQFLMAGKPVYIQSEYKSTFGTNIAFQSLVNTLGGTFNWTGTVQGVLAPMAVSSPFSNTSNNVSPLNYFWWGCAGVGNNTVFPFLTYNNQYFGFSFSPPNSTFGNLITTSDQDWIIQMTAPLLLENIITHLINGSAPVKLKTSVHSQTDILCNGDNTGTIVIKATDGGKPYQYYWSPNVSSKDTATGLAAGVYTCTVVDFYGDTSVETVTLTQPPAISVAHVIQHVGCPDGSDGMAAVTATGGVPPYRYSWLPSGINKDKATGLSTGLHEYTVTDTNNCTYKDTVRIYSPSVTRQAQDITICEFGDAMFTIAVDSPGMAYQWQVDNGNGFVDIVNNATYTGTGTDTLRVKDIERTMHAYRYRCEISGSCTYYSDPASLFVNNRNIPELSVTHSPEYICEGAEVAFASSLSYYVDGVSGYEWYRNNVPGGADDTAYSTNALLDKDVITVRVHIKNKCVDTVISASVPVEVHPHPEAQIAISNTEDICYGDTLWFAAADAGEGFTYQWQPYDVFSDETGRYVPGAINKEEDIKLVVSNNAQCADSQSVHIQGETCCRFFTPTAFTPNNDGLNDVFKLLSDVTVEVDFFRVYNRFGELVFETVNKNDGWDGTYKGKTADVGAYYYLLQYTCNAKVKQMKGSCTLIR